MWRCVNLCVFVCLHVHVCVHVVISTSVDYFHRQHPEHKTFIILFSNHVNKHTFFCYRLLLDLVFVSDRCNSIACG